jgi:DNA invertase Pin-like site-specific DNA recombinase
VVIMTRADEPVGMWVRVSTGSQDEENQIPDVERHCAARGYSVARRYELNDKSASKGEQQNKLDEMLHDMRNGTIKVLVCWHSDRLERRGPEFVFRLLAQVRDAGGRIESTKEPLFGATDMSGEAITALGAVMSHQYSIHRGEQVKLAHDRIRANGAVGPGSTPWGFRIVGPKYNKQLIPTDLCREYAPQIFQRCIDGDSYRTIAAWLDAEGVPPKRGIKWSEASISKIIHNRLYVGRRQNEARTQTLTKCETVVSADMFGRANDALKHRQHRGPVMKDRPLLAKLRCALCEDSPMFRIRIQSRKGGKAYYYYRCTGRGAQRKGCGNMVPYGLAEDIVRMMILALTTEPYRTREWVEGTNWDSQMSDVKQGMREAVEAEDFGKLPELQEKLAELRSREVTKGHWDYQDTGITVGEYFASLDDLGQREYLKTRHIRMGIAPKRDGLPGVRLIIDGQDYGVVRLAR